MGFHRLRFPYLLLKQCFSLIYNECRWNQVSTSPTKIQLETSIYIVCGIRLQKSTILGKGRSSKLDFKGFVSCGKFVFPISYFYISRSLVSNRDEKTIIFLSIRKIIVSKKVFLPQAHVYVIDLQFIVRKFPFPFHSKYCS